MDLTFNQQGAVVAERYLHALRRKYETGRFAKIVVSCMRMDDVLRKDEGALNVLVAYLLFDFASFQILTHLEQQQFLLSTLHERLVQIAHDYNFETTPLFDAYQAASAMGDDFTFLSKWKASFATPYRSAHLAFQFDGKRVQLVAEVKTSRGAVSRTFSVCGLETCPALLGYLIDDFVWLNASQLCLRFTPAAKKTDVVIAI